MSDLLQITGLAIERAGRSLLSGFDCSCKAGDLVVVLGPNGAGKSSFLLALAGLLPCVGELKLFGKPLSTYSRDELAMRIAWQGELPPTEFGLTVQQRLNLAATEESVAIEYVAQAMDIQSLLHRSLAELSAGERQRSELAALMLRNAPIWLLDEPTSHLDLKHQIQCIHMMKEQCRDGRVIITVLHDIQQAMAVADHLILIDGKGGIEYGEAKHFFTSERLTRLYDAPVMHQGAVFVPNYGEKL